MSRQPTIIYSADSPQQAHLLRSLLEDEGIQAWVVNDAIQIAGGELPIGWRGAAKVVVGDDEAAAARQFAEAFDHKAQQHFFEPVDDEEEITANDAQSVPRSWPLCPTCGQSRSARCPICGESGDDFTPADAPYSDQRGQSLFLCPACDDPIVPQWYRLCARCGHDFGVGLEIKPPRSARLEISPRMVIVLSILAIITAAITGYFVWLFAGPASQDGVCPHS